MCNLSLIINKSYIVSSTGRSQPSFIHPTEHNNITCHISHDISMSKSVNHTIIVKPLNFEALSFHSLISWLWKLCKICGPNFLPSHFFGIVSCVYLSTVSRWLWIYFYQWMTQKLYSKEWISKQPAGRNDSMLDDHTTFQKPKAAPANTWVSHAVFLRAANRAKIEHFNTG